jgi:tRNA threonylcarbamoyladenosine biosynthesis protein TsaE
MFVPLGNCALPSRRHTRRFARALADGLKPGDLVLLSGALGTGKTFAARCIARGLGLSEDTRVPSPTFPLSVEYACRHGLLVHADLYRLRDGGPATGGAPPADSVDDRVVEEVVRLGLRDRRQEGAIVLVEWGDGMEGALGGEADFRVHFSMDPEAGRSASWWASALDRARAVSTRIEEALAFHRPSP